MRLFSEEVIPTLTNANLNIITVKDYTEIFFDVYELEINGNKYITEKIDTHNGYPVVEIPIIYKNKQTTVPFVLQKGKFEVLYNEHNTVFVSDLSDNIDLHVEQEEADLVDELIITKRENFAKEIKEAKDNAKQYADNIKQQKLEEANKAIAIRKKRIDNEIADIKSDLINEFIKVTADLKSNFHQYKLAESDNIEELITTSVSDIYKELIDNIDSKSEEAYTQFSEKISKFASDTVGKLLSENIEVLSRNAKKTISSEVKNINNTVSKEIDQLRVEVNETVDQHNTNLVSLERANVELNDAITRNINKVLSRVGNVKKQIDDSIAKEINAIQNNITLAEDRITKFYDVKLDNINDKVNLLSEENKQSCIDLITESKNSLLQTISEIKTDVPNIIIERKDGLNQTIDLKKVKLELEKSITTKFSTEVMSLKRMMEMMSGGGSVAQQFANGGVMNGNLTVFGTISASQYLGLSGGGGGGVSGDYLPLSGGTLDGDLNVDGFLTVGDSVNFDGGVEFRTFVSDKIDLIAPNINLRATNGVSLTGNLSASGIINSPEYDVTGTDGMLTRSTDIRTWVRGTNELPVAESQPQGLTFSPDGSYMFVTGQINDSVYRYILDTPWDTTTGVLSGSALVTATGGAPTAMYFTSDGLMMFILDSTGDRVGRYSLTSAWDVSTATLDAGQTKVLTTISGMPAGASFDPRGLEFSPDGLKLFVCDDFTNRIYEISLNLAWDLASTMTLVTSYLIAATIDNGLRNISFNNNGTRLFVAGVTNIRIYEFKLATPYSLENVSFVGRTVDTANDTNLGGMYYNDDAQKCFYVGSSGDTVREFIVTPQPALIGTRPIILANPLSVNDRVLVNSLQITDTTASSNTTTGALLVAGGVGVGGTVRIGSELFIGGQVQAGGQIQSIANVQAGSSTTSNTAFLGIAQRSKIFSSADGLFRLTNSANNDFNILQLGGNVLSESAGIKRNGTGIDIVLADQTTAGSTPLSGFTDLRAANVTSTQLRLSGISGDTYITPNGNGVVTFTDNTSPDFNRIQLGGTSASFPAIKRNGTGIDIRDAADAGFTDLRAANITASGHLAATTKSFLIDNPIKGGKLQYGVVESNEHSIYVRGKTSEETIILPDHWEWLVDESKVTVQVTPIGKSMNLWVVEQNNKTVKIGGVEGSYNYTIYGTRKDVPELEVELEG